MKPSTTLTNARAVISTPDKWTKGEYARNKDGYPVLAKSPDANCFCLLGTIQLVSPDVDSYWDAREYLGIATDAPPTRFNDDPKRTHPEVIAALDKAIELALAAGD